MYRETVSGLEADRLHLCQFVLAEARLVVKEKRSVLLFAMVDIIRDWTIIDDEGDNPGFVVVTAARNREVSLVNIADAIKVYPNALVENLPIVSIPGKGHRLNLVGIWINHYIAYIVLRIFRDNFKVIRCQM